MFFKGNDGYFGLLWSEAHNYNLNDQTSQNTSCQSLQFDTIDDFRTYMHGVWSFILFESLSIGIVTQTLHDSRNANQIWDWIYFLLL